MLLNFRGLFKKNLNTAARYTSWFISNYGLIKYLLSNYLGDIIRVSGPDRLGLVKLLQLVVLLLDLLLWLLLLLFFLLIQIFDLMEKLINRQVMLYFVTGAM